MRFSASVQPSNVLGRFLTSEQSEYRSRHSFHLDLADGIGENGDDLLVSDGDDGAAVDFDDAVSDAHAAALRESPAQNGANDAILDGKAEGAADVGPLQPHLHHRRAGHHGEPGHRLRLGGLDVRLTGGERQADQRYAVDSQQLVADVELTALGRGALRHQICYHHRGQHGAPARLHDHDAHHFALE